jgi:hypothetical protein
MRQEKWTVKWFQRGLPVVFDMHICNMTEASDMKRKAMAGRLVWCRMVIEEQQKGPDPVCDHLPRSKVRLAGHAAGGVRKIEKKSACGATLAATLTSNWQRDV